MEDIFIYQIDLPCGINEAVMPCCDGYTIYLDINLSEEQKRAALQHALWHIKHNDFEKGDVQQIEVDAHKRGG